MKKLVAVLLVAASSVALADTVAQAWSDNGQKVRLTTDKCSKESGRSSYPYWGRTFAWYPDGTTYTGCGVLDNDTVLIEWQTPTGIETRRYEATDFTWSPRRNK